MSTVRLVRVWRSLTTVGVCLAMAALCGCGGDSSKATLSGKVTYKGAPLPSGTLTLYPETGASYPISLHADGTFSVSDAPVGVMGVGVETGLPGGIAMPPGTNQSAMPKITPIPLKYKDPKTSGLTWEIKGGRNNKDFELAD